jgi:PAS domain S-box-containing protein
MEEIVLIISLITAGVALMTGLNSLFAGAGKERNRFEVIFGIQAFLLFIYLIFPPTGFVVRDQPPYPLTLDIKRFFLWAYYFLFTIFLEGYSGYTNKPLKWTVFLSILVGFAIYLSTTPGQGIAPWRIFVLVPLGLVGIYGLFAARFQIRSSRAQEGRWLQTAMIIYFLLYLFSAGYIIRGTTLEKELGFYPFFVFHLNSLAFILIMSIRLRKDVLNRLRLEKLLRLREKRWDQLLDTIQLLAIELDPEGKVLYCNPFAVHCLGASSTEEIIGKNWFSSFVKPDSQQRLRSAFQETINGNPPSPGIKTPAIGLDGKEHVISWTTVLLPDEQGKIFSLMTLGIDSTQLDRAIREVEELKNELIKENVLMNEVESDGLQTEIVGSSEAIIYAIQKARQVATTNASVLLEGETGVGKELFANLIHRLSERRSKPLVKVNCAALPHELIESELFGHEKGSFTGALQARKGRFELADKGTIFLDEISELPLFLQPKLLRVLQSGEFERIGGQQTIKVDVRMISATNRNLMNEVKEERFRKDLFYRLNVYPITIPALRNRKSDIPLLVDHFVKLFATEFNKDIRNISKADLQRLEEYQWPGNIRELINLVERSVILSHGETLRIAWERTADRDRPESRPVSSIHDFERDHILRVLKDTNWRINGEDGAAERLGLNPNTLRSRMKKLNIVRGEQP